MWSLNSNSILASQCKQPDCKQQVARGEAGNGKSPPPAVAQEEWGLPPRGCIAVCRKSDSEMQPMGSKIAHWLDSGCNTTSGHYANLAAEQSGSILSTFYICPCSRCEVYFGSSVLLCSLVCVCVCVHVCVFHTHKCLCLDHRLFVFHSSRLHLEDQSQASSRSYGGAEHRSLVKIRAVSVNALAGIN